MKLTKGLLFLFLVPFAVSAAEPDFDAYSTYVTNAIKDWDVPAIAIAVVKDGEIVFAKGFGARTIGKDEPVDENTLFSIGSITKSFTSGALAILADEDKLKWLDKVLDHMPQFELFDPYVSREFMIEDLLSHRSGLARGDELWYGTTRTRDEIIHQVRNLEPSWSFRSTYGYQNIMFLAAGQLVPTITGTSWDDFVKTRIFTPLGMTNSYTSVVPLANIQNVATPHEKFDGKVAPVPHFNLDNTGPAGSIVSSASQMANWIKLHLAKGEFNGQRIISEANVLEMQKPHTIIPYEGRWADYAPDAHFLCYGLGWMLHDYHGVKVVQHGGAIDGMRAHLTFLPEENLGFVALGNRGGSVLCVALAYPIIDAYLGRPQRDWSGEFLAKVKKQEADTEKAEKEFKAKRDKHTRPSLKLEAYAGAYTSDLDGELTVSLRDGRLYVEASPVERGPLKHWQHDTFEADWEAAHRGSAYLTFTLNAEGEVSALQFPGRPDYKRKKADEKPSE